MTDQFKKKILLISNILLITYQRATYQYNQLSPLMTTITKKKYRPKGNNDSMSIISINTVNESVDIADTTVLTEPPRPLNNSVEIHDLESFINEEDKEPPKTYKFVYSFNEYLRFFMIKALPLKEKDMTIYHTEGTLEGPQAKCEKLIKNIKNQLQRYTVKVVKYNKDADIEEIQYRLEKKYGLKIYKRKFLQLTIKDLVQQYKFQEQSTNLLKRILKQQLILVRVQKKIEKDCINQIRQLITGEEENNSVLNSSIQSVKYQSQNINRSKDQLNSRYSQRDRQREEQKRIKEKQKQREKKQINKEKQRERQKQYKQNSKHHSSSESEQIVEEDEDEQTYYQKIKINSSKSDIRIPNFKKMEQPFEDDSISVVEAKRYKKEQLQNQKFYQRKNQKDHRYQQGREQKRYKECCPKDLNEQSGRGSKEYQDDFSRKRKENKLRLIQKYQFQDLDENEFTNWLSKNKFLSKKLVKLVTDEDPYDSNILTHSLQLYIDDEGQKTQSQLIQALEHYLKFRKVVMFKLQNDKYRDQLVQKYNQESDAITVKYIKGYKSPKWQQAQMWKHIINKSYSDNKKAANTQSFQLFFIEGLKNLVVQIEKQIRNDLSSEPKQDQMQQIIIKFPSEISDHIRNNKRMQDLIRQTVQKLVKDNFKHVCQLTSVQFALSNLNISLKVKNDQSNQFQNATRGQIQKKVLKQITIKDFDASCQIDKHTYAQLQKIAVIIHKQEKSFKYICSNLHLSDIIQKMMNIINVQNRIAQKDLPITDKIIVKKLTEYIQELTSNKKEYAEVKANYAAEQGKFKFYGREYYMQMLIKELQQYIGQIDEKRINYYQIIKRRVGDMLQKDNIMKQISAKYDIINHVNPIEVPCKIILSINSDSFKKKNILILKSKNLDYAPCGSVIAFRGLDEVELYKNSYFMKTFKNYISKQKADVFNEHTRKYIMMIKQNYAVSDTLKQALNISNTAENIVFIMPENGKESFVKTIIKQLLENKKFQSREVSIMIIEYGQSTDLLNQLKISPYVKGKKLQLQDQKLRKYYVEDNGTKFYYSDSGNRKILTASQKGFTKVILNNEDLNIMHISHTFYTQNLVIIHKQSSKQFPIKINNTKVCFELKNILYEIPQVQADNIMNAIRTNSGQLDLSLGVYEIDLTAMKQVNLFSDYERKLNFEQTIIKADVNQQQIQAFYNIKAAQIQYSYYFDENILDNFNTALSSINSFLQNRIKSKDISYKQLKNIEVADLEGLKTAIEEDQQTECTYNSVTKTIILKTLDETTLNRCEQMIAMILKNQNDRDPQQIRYPVEWQPQKDDIETFQVNKNTQQFANVQKLFTVANIKSLHRIQNKIIYKKYYEQSVFLQSMNEGKKVKTMRLFHGTRQTNPEQIYKDKEQSFNINYSSDNNLLGKGIYFAERSEYSNGYKYTQVVNSGNIFGLGATNLYSMFLCQVLVGESQKCLKHDGNIKDTSYKDTVKKIKFESMTDFLNNSNIFVVYKSRRAYPLYLIKY